jgi:hypothetical protein
LSLILEHSWHLFAVLKFKARALPMLGECSTTYIPSPWPFETGSHYIAQAGPELV